MIYKGKTYLLKQAGELGGACSQCVFNHCRSDCRATNTDCGIVGYFVEAPTQPTATVTAKFKSDGGSSDYYKLKIKRASDGQVFDCEMGDIIYSVFGGDFDLGNIVKACRRMHLDSQGAGKDGIDAEYDAKKIEWFTKDFLQRVKSKGD